MMRAVEILYAIPRLVIILIFINRLRHAPENWMAGAGWPGWCRTRGW